MTFLGKILSHKRSEVESRKRLIPVERLRSLPGFQTEPRSLVKSILARDFGIVAEIKKASPSAGVIRGSYDPVTIARQYAGAEAAGISVLTDEKFFHGSLEHIGPVREASALPVLRKDFVIDPYQVYESRAAGADAVLLIVAALEPDALCDLKDEAEALGMDVLVEVHNEPELEEALDAGARFVGVNNRSLHTFQVSLETSLSLGVLFPNGVARISESGISRPEDLADLRAAGYHGALVGSSLMQANDPGQALKSLTRGGLA